MVAFFWVCVLMRQRVGYICVRVVSKNINKTVCNLAAQMDN